MATTIKLQDTGTNIGTGSRLEAYWKNRGFESFYKKYRKGLDLPRQFHTVDSLDKMKQVFKIDQIGFGNWVTQEDRFNYISALTIALYDINKVCKFSGANMGLNKALSFSFGARGKGGATAHFEPFTFIINITRYVNGSTPKEKRFVLTGGAGAVAHEYGHALDYYFGLFKEKSTQTGSLSGGNSTRTRWDIEPTKLRKQMSELLEAIIWEIPYSKKSRYYQRLEANFEGDYWFCRAEIFARAFEKYVQVKLQKIGIKNLFLLDAKYDTRAYLTDAETIKLLPKFDALMRLMAAKL